MSRKQFLASIGVAIVALIGIPTILKAFGPSSESPGITSDSYGGHTESAQYRTLK
jgi:hypothetical protein